MTRGSKAMIVMLVAALGLWGCAQGPGGHSSASAERIRKLEEKCGRLEDDYRNVSATRDEYRQQIASLEAENQRLEKVRGQMLKEIEQKKVIAQERDLFKQQMEQRTGERDLLQTRCDRMKKGLQSLIGQDDAMAVPGATTPVASVPAGN
jgi:predicted RNase H-like nuclease (RuvC/YqgF family)